MKYNKIFIPLSAFFAVLLGVCVPDFFTHAQVFGNLFINLLKLFALPLICSALIATLGGLSGSSDALKAVSKKMLLYMLISEILAVIIALCLFNFFKPGVGADSSLILDGTELHHMGEESVSVVAFITSIIPDNIFHSLAHFDLLPVVIFSILFGLGCKVAGEIARPMVQVAAAIREASTKCLNGVMLFAPLGIFALVGSGVAKSRMSGKFEESFVSLIVFTLVLLLGLFLHALWQLLVVRWVTGQKISHILRTCLPVFSTAFGTSSSVATLPVAMQTADLLKAKPWVSRFMLPLSASINVGGMMMYEMAAALFFSQMLGIELSVSEQILLAIACILGGMAEGGIPETSMVSLVVVFRMVHVPLSAISFLLPLDRIIDRFRTVVNIFGNICGVATVSHLVDQETLADTAVGDPT